MRHALQQVTHIVALHDRGGCHFSIARSIADHDLEITHAHVSVGLEQDRRQSLLMYRQWSFKILSSIGVIIHLLFIDIPKDLLRWLTMTEKEVRGQLVVITGGGSGLGRCMAQILAIEKGARVVIIDVNLEGALETVKTIESRNGKAFAYGCDITNNNNLEEIAASIREEHGTVDIVVCNAAVLTFALFKYLTVEQLRQSLEVNVLGTINTIRAFLKPMEERNSGQIVAVSSIAGFSGETYGMAYCPSKFAVRGVMECLQMELRDRGLDGIACTTLCPYFSRTPMVLNVGMRPTCTWFPFMSVESCSRRMVDAILKEKCISFMPNYVCLVPMIKGLLSVNAARSLREYLSIDYNPNGGMEFSHKRKTLPSDEYFQSPHFVWWLIVFAFFLMLGILSSPYYSNSLSAFEMLLPTVVRQHRLTVVVLSCIVVCLHFLEGIYTLLLCDELRFSFACAAKWFLQTACIGYPSLKILMAHVHKTRKQQ
ncbi:hypothetical protein Q1695_001667 [Nippostrongylus brasiliensis]|nr:hypothetical protein Q1695_001667 [Nippostrongylus brasiliensis]